MNCAQCPLECGADRQIKAGACGVRGLKIAKYYLHPFEEPVISYSKGSGCIFFCGCSLKCAFCQNFELSRNTRGKEIDERELARIFCELEEMGADNINLVNPTHYLRHIMGAMQIYRPKIPVVWNSHGYEKVELLKQVEPYVDIWLPDLKFIDGALSKRYTGKADYAKYAMPAIEFMARKNSVISGDGKLLSGCIVRHLVLPLAAYDSVNVVKFVSSLPEQTYFSLMSQYTPCGEIESLPELQRKITRREYGRVVSAVREAGLKRVFLQDYESANVQYIPEWDY